MRTILPDEDTLLTTTYCLIDDLYRAIAHHARRPGPPPRVSDSEVLTLSVLAQLKGIKSERSLVRHARAHWRAYFPKLISQSEFNRRARDLTSLLAHLATNLAVNTEREHHPASSLEVIDGAPVPLMRRCRAGRERLFTPDAAFGRGGSDHDQYYGLKLVLSVTGAGFITGFVAGPANTEERWLAESLFRWRHNPRLPPPSSEELSLALGPSHRAGGKRKGPSGRIGPRHAVGQATSEVTLADLNYWGRAWQAHWREAYGVVVVTARDLAVHSGDPVSVRRFFHAARQVVESVIAHLTELGLHFPLARTLWGAWQRLAAKVTAHNITTLLHHPQPT